MYRVEAARNRVKRELKRIPKGDRDRIGKAVSALSEVPRQEGAIQLQPGVYRIRVGDYRVVYKIQDDRELVLIGRIARRGEDTYKGLGGLFSQ